MKTPLSGLAALLVLGGLPAAAQGTRRPAPPEKPSPVSVSRSATMRITIASDTVGIFAYLSEPDKLTMWFPDQAIIEARLGGKYHFRFQGEEGVWSGVVTEFIRGNTLGYTWMPPGETVETAVHFKLSPQGGQTLVELTQSGFSSSSEQEKAVVAWTFYLENLKSVIEEGSDLRQTRRRPARKPVRKRG
ncbi:MAG: SRPBCC domain-containing protein [Terriglobia bacterium]